MAILENDVKKTQSALKTKHISIIESVTEKLLNKITDLEVRKVFLTKIESEKPVLYELVEQALHFDEDKCRQASFCKSSYAFLGHADKESAAELVKKINQCGKAFSPIAEFHSHLPLNGICFSLTLL